MASKYLTPRLPHYLVGRPRLTRTLDNESGHVLVVGPAGVGKSVLIREWLARHPTWEVVWIGLDADDEDPDRFWRIATAGALRVRDGAGPSRREPGTVDRFVDAVARTARGQPLVVVFDDYDVITDGRTHQDMARLLAMSGLPIRVVFSVRADPPVPLRRWWAASRGHELRERDLLCTMDEAAQLLERLGVIDLDPELVEVVWEHAHGRLAGIQLVALALPGHDHVKAFIETLDAFDQPLLCESVFDEVLRQLAPGLRDFLLRSSVLEVMGSELCEAITERWDCAALLNELSARGLFVTALEGDGDWYRSHRPFRALLKAELRAAGLGNEPELHRRAAAWFANGEPVLAVEHALAAGDDQLCVRLIVDSYPLLEGRTTSARVNRWIRRLSLGTGEPATSEQDPARVEVVACLRAMTGGRTDGTQRASPSAARAIDAARRGDADTFRALVGSASSWRGDGCLPAAMAIGLWGVRMSTMAGRLDEGHQWVAAVRRFLPPDADVERAALIGVQAELVWCQGNVREAADRVVQAVAADPAARPLGDHAVSDAYRALAGVHLDAGELADADDALRLTVAVDECWPSPYQIGSTTLLAAELLRAKARPIDALDLLTSRDMRQNVGPAQGSALAARVAEATARAVLDCGDVRRAARLAGEMPRRSYAAAVMQVRLALALGERARASALLASLVPGCRRRRIERALLGARAALPDIGQSATSIAAAIELSQGEPLGWAFAQEADLWPLYEHLATHARYGGQEAALDPLDRFLRSGPTEPLTRRELDLLALLPTQLSNPEIAARLVISPNTVKTHLKNVYRKLGVTSRPDAVTRAHACGLVPATVRDRG